MERIVLNIEVKYDEEAGPVPDLDALKAKFNDLLSKDWVLDPTGEEKVLGFGVEVSNTKARVTELGTNEFIEDIDKYVLSYAD